MTNCHACGNPATTTRSEGGSTPTYDLCEADAAAFDAATDDALSQEECDAIGADGRDGRGTITESNLTDSERAALSEYRTERELDRLSNPVSDETELEKAAAYGDR